MKLTELLEKISEEKKISIYGAQMVATSVYTALCDISCIESKIVNFVISDTKSNHDVLYNTKVVSIHQYCTQNDNKDILMIIATPIIHHEVICKLLRDNEIYHYLCIDSDLENAIMMNYYTKNNMFRILSCSSKTDHHKMGKLLTPIDSVKVYMAKCIFDKKLSQNYNNPLWIEPIQVGSSLTNTKIAEVKDNYGQNISNKNKEYCELTGMYWIWKNDSSEYVGLCHYRRIMKLDETSLHRLISNDVDVILPLPSILYPNAEQHHTRYITENEWDACKKAVSELQPEYYHEFQNIFMQEYFYNYNMIIANKKNWGDLCSWLFPILQRIELICYENNYKTSNRYMGYLGENLITLYFMYNKNSIRIGHVGTELRT